MLIFTGTLQLLVDFKRQFVLSQPCFLKAFFYFFLWTLVEHLLPVTQLLLSHGQPLHTVSRYRWGSEGHRCNAS